MLVPHAVRCRTGLLLLNAEEALDEWDIQALKRYCNLALPDKGIMVRFKKESSDCLSNFTLRLTFQLTGQKKGGNRPPLIFQNYFLITLRRPMAPMAAACCFMMTLCFSR